MPDPIIDPATFAELQDSAGADFTSELVDTFLDEAPAMLAALRSALAQGDADAFRRNAHSLKSNSQTFGATQLGVLARELELVGLAALGGAGSAKASAAVDQLGKAYDQAAVALKALCHGG